MSSVGFSELCSSLSNFLKGFLHFVCFFLSFFSPSVHRAAVTAHLELFSQDADTAGVCSGRLALLLTERYHVDGHIVIIIMTVVHLCVDGFCFLHQRELICFFFFFKIM